METKEELDFYIKKLCVALGISYEDIYEKPKLLNRFEILKGEC
jgi:hypothetical protein